MERPRMLNLDQATIAISKQRAIYHCTYCNSESHDILDCSMYEYHHEDAFPEVLARRQAQEFETKEEFDAMVVSLKAFIEREIMPAIRKKRNENV